MDNFEVAMSGVALAARILNIKTPDVQFFNDINLNMKGINAVFLKEKMIIAFNELWISSANILEIQTTCFHETRHVFQWECITGEYSEKHNVDPKTIQIWKKEMTNYSQPTSKEIPGETYLGQEIEIDAIAFAHCLMSELYDTTTVIPDVIMQKVIQKKKDLMEEFR